MSYRHNSVTFTEKWKFQKISCLVLLTDVEIVFESKFVNIGLSDRQLLAVYC